jgi:amino acid transporter
MATFSEKVEGQVTGETGLFLRKATGLVREVSAFDAAIMNTLSMNLGIGIALLFIWGPYLLPGGNMYLAVTICTLVVAFSTAYVYAVGSGAFPRSGADYVFTSRILGPLWGFLYSVQFIIWGFFWMGFNTWALANLALPQMFTALGVIMGRPDLVAVGSQFTSVWAIIAVSVVCQVLFALLAVYGTRPFFRYMKITLSIALAAIAASIFLLVLRGGEFAVRWDAVVASSSQGLPFAKIISEAARLGYNSNQPFSFAQTLALMPLVFWMVGYFAMSQVVSGEVKKARSSQYVAMVGVTLVYGAIILLITWLVVRSIGTTFLGSLGFLYFEHPEVLNMSAQPNFNYLVSLLTQSAPLIALIGIGYAFWTVNGTPNWLWVIPRYLLSYSFDRMAPESMGEVDERFHTPVKAIIFSAAMGLVAVVVLILWQEASLLSVVLAQMWFFMVYSVAAIIFPYKFPKLWQSTTTARKVAGLPLISIAGAVSVIFTAVVSYYFLAYSVFGASSSASLIAVVVTILCGAVYYYGYRAYQKSRGVDVDLAYKEIPPE